MLTSSPGARCVPSGNVNAIRATSLSPWYFMATRMIGVSELGLLTSWFIRQSLLSDFRQRTSQSLWCVMVTLSFGACNDPSWATAGPATPRRQNATHRVAAKVRRDALVMAAPYSVCHSAPRLFSLNVYFTYRRRGHR